METVHILYLLLGCMVLGLVMIIIDQTSTGGGSGTWRGLGIIACSGALLIFLYRRYMDS